MSDRKHYDDDQYDDPDNLPEVLESNGQRRRATTGGPDFTYDDDDDGLIVDSYAALNASDNPSRQSDSPFDPNNPQGGPNGSDVSSQSLMADMRDKITQKVIKMEELRRNREWKKSMDKRMEQLEEVRGRIQAKRAELRQKQGPRTTLDGSTPPDDGDDGQSTRSSLAARMEMNTAEQRYIRKAEFRKWRAHTRLELARRIGGTAPSAYDMSNRTSPPMDDANDEMLYGDYNANDAASDELRDDVDQ